MNEQAVYNKVRAYFSKPNAERAVDARGDCRYRTPSKDGTKILRCGIGCLIPNRLYRVGMEGRDVTRVLENFPDVREYFAGVGEDFLLDIQNAHDSASTVKGLLRKLDAVARRYRVKVAS